MCLVVSAVEIMGTFAQAVSANAIRHPCDGIPGVFLTEIACVCVQTWEGPFGQAHEVPQMSTPPYTPFDDEPSFKPIAGVTR